MQSAELSLWEQAVKEAGLENRVHTISEFGRSVPKIPKSMVETLLKMQKSNENPRNHKYNFMGRVYGNPGFNNQEDQARQWAIDFAMTNFSNSDIFVNTHPGDKVDDPTKDAAWKKLGGFDHTDEFGDKTKHQIEAGVDKTYWKNMLTSQFTLCPGGDTKWSMRAYEAALAGSICVVKSYDDDMKPETSKMCGDQMLQKVFDMFKTVTKDDPHEYSETIASQNREIFMKYLTFMKGDNTPP
jgi:hypothetical protein